MAICYVVLREANEGKADPDYAERGLTWNLDDSYDLYDNGFALKDFKLPRKGWS